MRMVEELHKKNCILKKYSKEQMVILMATDRQAGKVGG